MSIIGIDPGPEHSAWACWLGSNETSVSTGDIDNAEARGLFRWDFQLISTDTVVIEWLVPYNVPASKGVLNTCRWVGHFEDMAWQQGAHVVLVDRPTIVRHFCGNTSWKDKQGNRQAVTKPMVKQALYDRFGGDRKAAVGTKKKPGPLYGIKGDHQFDALACAVWYAETNKNA